MERQGRSHGSEVLVDGFLYNLGMRSAPALTLLAFLCAPIVPPAVSAQLDYRKAIGAPVDGRLRPSNIEGLREAYLVPIFPSAHAANLLELKNGDLLCAWFSGTWEGNSDVAIVLSRLPAGSDQWTKPQVVDHHRGESYQNPVLFQAPDGVIWLIHTTQGAGEGQANAKVLVAKSKDNGKTWNGPDVLFDQPGAFVRDPILVLADGTWMLPMYFTPTKGITTGAEAHYSVVKLSHDQGLHWENSRIPNSNGYVQPSVVRLKSGKYVAFFRSRFADNVFRSTSDDGKTWTAPARTDLPNNNASVQAAVLKDGNVVMAFNNVGSVVTDGKPKAGPRKPLSVALSKDGGETWTEVRDLETGKLPPGADPIPAESKAPGREEFSYPTILQTRGGSIHVAYTYRRYTIKDVVFSEDWLAKGSSVGVAKGARASSVSERIRSVVCFRRQLLGYRRGLSGREWADGRGLSSEAARPGIGAVECAQLFPCQPRFRSQRRANGTRLRSQSGKRDARLRHGEPG